MHTDFKPLPCFGNKHIQTLLPHVLRRHPVIVPVWQRLELPDGDFIDLAWSAPPEQAKHKPRVVLLHGLAGSVQSPYANGLLKAFADQGWLGVVMHFRGCSGEPNRKDRLYYIDDLQDIDYLLHWMDTSLGKHNTAIVGVSLGGCSLANYLAQKKAQATIKAGMIISSPLMLEACSRHLDSVMWGRLYDRYLLSELKKHAIDKLEKYPNSIPVTVEEVKKLKSIKEFDNKITSPVHGFNDAYDYYQKCSSIDVLSSITVPLLILVAQDDPLVIQQSVPDPQTLPDNIKLKVTQHGGHVGFISGSVFKPIFWLEKFVPEWLAQYI